MYWLALFVAVVANAAANLAFKKAVMRTPLDEGFSAFLKLAAEPWMWLGVCLSLVLLFSYLYALRGIDLSVAYPAVTGLAILGIVLAGGLFLGENMSLLKLFAMALIVAGVVLLKVNA